MTAMPAKEDNSALLSQCLDFCQILASKSLAFSFNLTTRDGFSFSLDTNGNDSVASKGKKKKKTPSTLKRDARRRDEFLKKKLEVSTGDASLPSENVSVEEAVGKQAVENALDEKAFKCDQCDSIFKSENGLKIHVGKSHKKVNPMLSTPDQLRQQSGGSVSLSASPLLDTRREEPCSNRDFECGSCYFACSDGETLKIHRSSVHKLPRKCSDCDLVFQDFVSLMAHAKIHMGIESDSD